jgi:putative GTP pyrophosphokinase
LSIFVQPPASKSAVRRAGKAIGSNVQTTVDLELVEQWRASHAYVLNTFQIFLKRRLDAKGRPAEFAQRLKRKKTVLDKLQRKHSDGTPLIADVSAMNDFAGCRLIFDSLEELYSFRKYVNSAEAMSNVKHKLKYDLGKYDYIENPKSSGYRGIHDVFQHFPRAHRRNDDSSKPWHGLLVEVQYRTRVQHAWATALEISDIIDNQRTKFALQDDDRVQFFALASEALARHFEHRERAFLEHSLGQIVANIVKLETNLGILQRLEALRQFEGYENIRKHNVLNIVSDSSGRHSLVVENFPNATKAVQRTTQLEEDDTSLNAVYVRAENPTLLRSAYRNYFFDPVDFVSLIKEVISDLSID